MEADGLARYVALDPLGTHVPRRDVAGGVKHEDRVVADVRDQEAEQPLYLGAFLRLHTELLLQVSLQMRSARKLTLKRLDLGSGCGFHFPHHWSPHDSDGERHGNGFCKARA